LRHPARERRNLQVEANASHDFGPDISVRTPSLTVGDSNDKNDGFGDGNGIEVNSNGSLIKVWQGWLVVKVDTEQWARWPSLGGFLVYKASLSLFLWYSSCCSLSVSVF